MYVTVLCDFVQDCKSIQVFLVIRKMCIADKIEKLYGIESYCIEYNIL